MTAMITSGINKLPSKIITIIDIVLSLFHGIPHAKDLVCPLLLAWYIAL